MSKRAAVLVIDVQLAAFDGENYPAVPRGEVVLREASKLIAAARTAGTPVIFIQHCGTPDQLYAEGTKGWVIHPSIAPDPSETIVQKRASSAFDDTELRTILEDEAVGTVITCGLQSEFCVTNTSVAALELGFDVLVAGDAHSTWPTDDDAAETIIARQNALLASRGARVRSTTELAELLGSGFCF